MTINPKEVFRNLFILFLFLSIGTGISGLLILKDNNDINNAYLKGVKKKNIEVRTTNRSNFSSHSTGGYIDIFSCKDTVKYNYYVHSFNEGQFIEKNIKAGDIITVQWINWGNAVYVIGLKKGNKVFRDPKNYLQASANESRSMMIVLLVISGLLSLGFIYNLTKYIYY
jgi:hypothetical protein